jgi:hypothetical protein
MVCRDQSINNLDAEIEHEVQGQRAACDAVFEPLSLK